jgi:anaerobic magnesium-protoporphyrin IX monomethyl ester cyclase
MTGLQSKDNVGAHTRQQITVSAAPLADGALSLRAPVANGQQVDLLLVNPPPPDGGIWIRGQHRVGRRSREGMVWPQVSLAQMAALFPDLRVAVVDAVAERMGWPAFEALLGARRPRYYVTQLTGPTLQNDMYGAFLARGRGAVTVAFGTHITPMPVTTLRDYPALDYGLRGEPELTLRELLDTLEAERSGVAGPNAWWPHVQPSFAARLVRLFEGAQPGWRPAWLTPGALALRLERIAGLVWRSDGQVIVNADRPLIASLDDLPMPLHELLPLQHYRAPLVGGPYSFVVTSRGCPAGCRFCIKHVSYGRSVRWRSAASVLDEVERLVALGLHHVHMYADLFTVSREQVMGICQGLLQRNLNVRWTCNSRVDCVDDELLDMMAQSGCWMISWGLESGSDAMLQRMHKGVTTENAARALQAARRAGIKNWGYFVIGLPGETEASVQETIAFAKRLPLDLALFHIAAPHPGTPFFFEVVEQGWFRPGTRWEQVDMDRSTVLDYPDVSAEQIESWARRAFRAWALRPGPLWTYVRMLLGSPSLWRPALALGLESLGWARRR